MGYIHLQEVITEHELGEPLCSRLVQMEKHPEGSLFFDPPVFYGFKEELTDLWLPHDYSEY